MSRAYVALGSNLGDREENLRNALKHLQENGVEVIKTSTFIETEPYGVTDQPGFVNAVCQVETELAPLELLRLLLKIEQEMGRVRLRRWGERNIDLDLLLYEEPVDFPEILSNIALIESEELLFFPCNFPSSILTYFYVSVLRLRSKLQLRRRIRSMN